MIKDFLLAQFVERITPWRDLCRRCSLKHHLKQFKDLGRCWCGVDDPRAGLMKCGELCKSCISQRLQADLAEGGECRCPCKHGETEMEDGGCGRCGSVWLMPRHAPDDISTLGRYSTKPRPWPQPPCGQKVVRRHPCQLPCRRGEEMCAKHIALSSKVRCQHECKTGRICKKTCLEGSSVCGLHRLKSSQSPNASQNAPSNASQSPNASSNAKRFPERPLKRFPIAHPPNLSRLETVAWAAKYGRWW